MRSKFTEAEREERRQRRAQVREGLTLARAEIRAWREDRGRRAEKRAEERRKKFAEDKSRGVHRVPKRLRNLAPTVEVETPELGTYRGRAENYATRRRMGQRGHAQRRAMQPRRRDMPGAVERRLERAQAEWLA